MATKAKAPAAAPAAKPKTAKEVREEAEKLLQKLTEDVLNSEAAIRDTEKTLISSLQRTYFALLPDKPKEGAKEEATDKKEKNAFVKEFQGAVAAHSKGVTTWLDQLEKQQKAVASVRTAACQEMLELHKSNDKSALHATLEQTSKLLSTASLRSADDFKNWGTISSNLDASKVEGKKEMTPTEYAKLFEGKLGGANIVLKEFIKPSAEDLKFFSSPEGFERLRKLENPALLRYVAMNKDEHKIAYEQAKRGSLGQKHTEPSHLNFERKAKLAKSISAAMYGLHNHKEGAAESRVLKPILHYRLKPSNVLLTSDFKVKIGDFGRPLDLNNKEALFKGGYLPYFAPELFEGKPQTEDTDVYAYGMLLFYLFTNQVPFAAEKPASYDDYHKLHKSGHAKLVAELDKQRKDPIPEVIRLLILDCIKPSQRPSLYAILRASDIPKFDLALTQYTSLTRGEAANIWPEAEERLKFTEFAQKWNAEFPLTEEHKLMMRALMNIPMDGEQDIEKAKFDSFMKWFGPITKANYSQMWDAIKGIMKSPWFHGCINGETAKKRLRENNGDKNFLVRLNTYAADEKPEPLILIYRKEKKTFEAAFSFKSYPYDPVVEMKEILKKKKIEDLAPCTADRPTTLSRPFDHTQNKGAGYKTDTSSLAALDFPLGDD